MKLPSKGGLFPLFLYLLSLSIGVINLFTFRDFPTFYCPPPVLDADFYDFLAKLAFKGDSFLSSEPYFYSPLFLWIKVSLLKLFNEDVYSLKVLSLFVGSSIPVALFLIAKELFSNRFYALISYFFGAFYGPFLFFQVQSLKTIYGLFLITWGLYFLILSKKYSFLLAGICFSFALLIYNNLLLPTGFMFLFLLIRDRKTALLFLFPVVLTLSLTTYRNYSVSGDLIALTAVGGIHFYIGNNPNANGLYVRPEGIRPNAFGHYYDVIRVASKEYRREVSASEASRFFYLKALEYIKENPVEWMKLTAKKTLLALSGREFSNNEDYQYYREKISFHKHITLSSYTIFTLGLAGFIAGAFISKNWRYWVVFTFSVSYLLSISLFFIADRYRLPLAIPLILSIPYLFYTLKGGLRTKSGLVLVLIASTIIVFYPWKLEKVPSTQEIKVEYAKLICSLKSALRNAESDELKSRIYTEIAELYMSVGGWEQARYYYKRAFLADRSNEYAELNYYKLGIFGVVDVEKR